jgi:hypothetical protein
VAGTPAERLGGLALIVGSMLLTVYAALFPVVLPIGTGRYDFVRVVLDPNWVRLALLAFAGVLLMIVGFYAAYSRLRATAGRVGAIGFVFVEAAYLLQACKVSSELFLYPAIARHDESAFLLRDALLKHDPAVTIFRGVSAATILVGIVLFCYTLFRSDEYPKASAVLIFVGALVYAIGPAISLFVSVAGIVTLSIGCLLVGLRLFRTQPA